MWTALRSGRRVACVDDKAQRTYFEYVVGACMFSRLIERETKSQHVGLMLPTSAAMPLGVVGSWMAGRVAVPINYLLGREEMQYCMKHAPVDTLLTVGPMLDFVGGIEAIPEGVKVVRVEEELPKMGKLSSLRLWPGTSPDQAAVILYTSGTSGKPKGVPLTFGNFEANLEAAIERAKITRSDVFLGVLPQFHSFGLTACTLFPLAMGCKAVYTARFLPKKIIELMREHRPTIFMAVPSMYGALLALKDASAEDFASLRLCISGGEPLSEGLRTEMKQRFNVDLLEGYGLTETTPVVSWSTPEKNRPGYAGQVLRNVEVVIAGEDDRVLPASEQGEILISGPSVFPGYHRDHDGTQAVFTEIQGKRYFRTGDIGMLDEERMLAITGRKKEMIIVGGFNVFPRTIEEVLNSHPSVRDSGVVGKTDGMRGEVPVAYVEIKDGERFDEGALRAWCREKLAGYKVPREIIRVDTLPRTPTGKVLRRKLKELM